MEKAMLLLEKHGERGYIGEDLTQKQHAVQAALLAEDYCEENNILIKKDLVLAALLHDIGHLLLYEDEKIEKMGDLGILHHEKQGAVYLKNLGYSDLVCKLVESHVKTKRYMISCDKNYYNNLSDASKKTFNYQGGIMKLYEILNFEKNPLFKYFLKIREWDDMAKMTNPELLKKIDELTILDRYVKYL